MAEVARLFATISADTSKLQSGLEDSRAKLGSFGTAMGQMQTLVTGAFVAMGAAAAGMATAVAKTGFDFLAMKEQSEIAFTTMLGSGEAAEGMLNRLQEFAAKTPFEFPDLIRASQRMMAMGFSASEVIPTLTAVGDAVAALGGGQVQIDRVTTALGQMNAKGKTSAEEMMQLTEAGIPAWQMLADKIGVTVPEAMKMVTKGAVDARTTISAVVEGIDQRFGGMMEAQSTTWNGLLSNLKDGFTQMSGSIMKPFFEQAKAGLATVVPAVSAFNEAIRKGVSFTDALMQSLAMMLPESWMKAIARAVEYLENLMTVVKAAMKPIGDAIGKFLKWEDVLVAVGIALSAGVALAVGALISAMMPMITTLAAITAAVAAFRWAWENDFAGIRTFTQNTLQRMSDWFFKESDIWKGTWEDTAAHIADRIRKFFQIDLFNYTVGTWSRIRMELNSLWIKIRRGATELALGMRDDFLGWTNSTIGTITNWKDRMISAFQRVWNPLAKDISDWSVTTLAKLERWRDWGIRYIKEWRDNIVERFKSVFTWWDSHIRPFVDKGRDIIQGLWDGAKQVWERFKNWWRGLWDQLTGTVDVKLRIGSPSKEMMERGKWAVEGFAKGAQQAMPMALGAMNGLAQGTMGRPYAPAATPAVSTSRIEELLLILIQELRAKNMTANVTVAGAGGYGNLVTHTDGLRR
jgi:tape measure domain-containing protein